jgi:hypothetical protein
LKVFLCFALAYLCVIPGTVAGQKSVPQPLYTTDISDLIPSGKNIYVTGSLAFLSDKTLAVVMCSNVGCNIETFEIEDTKVRTVARQDALGRFSDLFRAPTGGVVLTLPGPETVLLDWRLDRSRTIPKTWLSPATISDTGAMFVQSVGKKWQIFKIEEPTIPIRSGTGEPVSVSDERIAYIEEGILKIDTVDGRHLGSFRAAKPSEANPHVQFLGKDRLWFDDAKKPQIRDFNGKILLSFKKTDGWGFRTGRSADGSRVVLDLHTRHVPLMQNVKETTVLFLSFGMGVGDESDNGETVRVVDTNTGKLCFEWKSRPDFLSGGDYHADLEPSGHRVAIMTRTSLSIFELPSTCGD